MAKLTARGVYAMVRNGKECNNLDFFGGFRKGRQLRLHRASNSQCGGLAVGLKIRCARVQVDSQLVVEFCCKVAVIFLALYAVKFSVFCSNDCFAAENG